MRISTLIAALPRPSALSVTGTILIALVTGLLANSAMAQCVPAAGAGTPVAGTIVTCDTTTNQGPNSPTLNNGYGDGSQAGITINVNPNAIVTGFASTPANANGIFVGNNNTINLLAGATQVTEIGRAHV